MPSERKSIMAYAPQTLLSVTGARLCTLDFTVYTNDEKLEILRWLVVCNKDAEALVRLQQMPADALSPPQQQMLYAIQLRIHLKKRSLAPYPEEERTGLRWVKSFKSAGEEIVYPMQLHGFNIVSAGSNKLCLALSMTCIACGATVTSTTHSDLFPHASVAGQTWLCPECLAVQSWDKRVLRDTLWDKFSAYFAILPVDAAGKLSDEDAWATLLLANVLEPYAPVRFCSFRQDRIGHLCHGGVRILEQMGGSEKLTLDFYGFETQFFTSNKVLAGLWKRFFNSTVAAQQLYWLAHTSGMSHLGPLVQHPTYTDPHSGRYIYPLHMNFFEMQQGMRALEAMGVPRGAKIACLFVRDAAYLSCEHPLGGDNKNEYRNSDIDRYQKACEELALRGWYVLRMGAAVAKPLTWTSDHIIDYATHYRTEFMDVWLLLYSDLCLSMGTGPDILYALRNRPCLLSNAVDIFYIALLSPDSLVLPKHIVHAKTQQPVSLEDYLIHDAAYESVIKNITEEKFCYIDNTSEEIYAALCEQLAVIEGTQHYSQADIAMRKKYQKLGSHRYENWGEMRANFSLVSLHAEYRNFTV